MLFSSASPQHEGDAARMVREVERRLAGGIARADEVEVEAVVSRRPRCAPHRSRRPFRSIGRSRRCRAAPDDAGGEDHGPRPDDLIAVEGDITCAGSIRGGNASPGSPRRAGAPAGARGWRARRPRRRWGTRGSSRSARTCRPGRPAPRARRRWSADLRTPHRPPRRGPAGPPPTTITSYSAAAARVCRPTRSATSRLEGRATSAVGGRGSPGSRRLAGSSPPQRAARRPRRASANRK